MAIFKLTLTTEARRRPQDRTADIEERARLQAALLAVVSQVSNNRVYDGAINHLGITGIFEYSCEKEKA